MVGQTADPMRANGLELSCPAARASPHSFSRNLAGMSRFIFPHASRVSCSELLGGDYHIHNASRVEEPDVNQASVADMEMIQPLRRE
jgi:hypothetical protein